MKRKLPQRCSADLAAVLEHRLKVEALTGDPAHRCARHRVLDDVSTLAREPLPCRVTLKLHHRIASDTFFKPITWS